MVQPLWKTVWLFLKRVNVELSYDLAIPLLGIYPRELRVYVHAKKKMYTNVHSSIIHNRQKHSLIAKCSPAEKWINKCDMFIQWNIIWQYYFGMEDRYTLQHE